MVASKLTLTWERLSGYQSIMREETVSWKYFKRDVVPFAAMIAVECTTVGSSTLYKAATLRGFSFYVFVFYSYVGASLVLLLLSLIFGRYLIFSKQLWLLPSFKNMNLLILNMQVEKFTYSQVSSLLQDLLTCPSRVMIYSSS